MSSSNRASFKITKPARKDVPRCRPNVLPCRVHHSGPVNATPRYWNPQNASGDDFATVYFRGRKLRGRTIPLPEDYSGVMLRVADGVSKERLLPTEQDSDDACIDGAEEDEEDEEDELEDVKAMEQVATFDNVTVWGHEAAPDDKEDPYVRAIAEWIKFAETLHKTQSPPARWKEQAGSSN